MNKLICIYIILVLLLSCKSENKTNKNSNETDSTSTKQIETWDNMYGGADKAYDIELLKLREEIVPKFQTLEFKDSIAGRTMIYNLFIPKNYNKNKSYPLIQFIADASTVGKAAASRRGSP